MWRVSICWYRFGRIGSASRWILWALDAPDCPIPLRLSDSFEAAGSRSNGRKGQRGKRLIGLGFRWALRRERPGIVQRRCSGGPGGRRRGVRGATRLGELASVIGGCRQGQRWRLQANGVVPGCGGSEMGVDVIILHKDDEGRNWEGAHDHLEQKDIAGS
jgi:hypothetical protein